MSESRPRTSVVALLRNRFTALWLAPVLALVALGSWAFASPLASSPDDDFHLASIWCAGTLPSSQCEPGVSVYHAVPVALIRAPCFAHVEETSAACQAPFLADPTLTAQTNRANFNHNYPPVYYAVMSLFVSQDFVTSALVMRFVTIVLFVALTTALFLLLPRRLRGPLLWGWMVTTVPLGLFLLASNNPSSWALIGVGSAWLALLGYLETTGRRRIALAALFLLSSLLAAGSRADAAIYLVLTFGVVVILTFRRERAYLLSLILPAVVAVGAFLLFVGTQQAAVSNTGLSDPTAPSAGAALSPFALLAYNLLNVPQLWAGIFAEGDWGLGWLDTTMPAVVSIGALLVFAGVVFSGLRAISWRKVIGILALVATLWLLPTYVLVRGNNAVGENVQPRYLLPLIIVLAALMVLEAGGRGPLRFNKFQVAIIVAALAVANSIALHTNIRRYVTGTDQPGVNLDAHPEWWWSIPISPMGVWVLGTVSFAALIALLARSIASPRVSLP